jgi:hypothetical protein
METQAKALLGVTATAKAAISCESEMVPIKVFVVAFSTGTVLAILGVLGFATPMSAT